VRILLNIQYFFHHNNYEINLIHPYPLRAFQQYRKHGKKHSSLGDFNDRKKASNSLCNGFAQYYMTMINILFQRATP
jgi:hypothetical protein